MIRLFVGLPLPAEVADELGAKASGVPGARWVAPRNMHVTLRFIGEVEEGLAQEIHDGLSELDCPGFDLILSGFGFFGSRQPHALWAGVEKTPGLVHLRDKVESCVVRLGLDPEPRKFTPHVTLARLKDTPPSRVQDFLSAHSPYQAGPFPVEAFTLFRSHLGRGGAEYEALESYPLA